jgi:citrate/tricarballylate utilization protein
MQSPKVREDARRAMEICNACRYCEGYCAVFPAMELRRTFPDDTLEYLANLCHGCRGCYFACQYAPPHEFNLNIPRTFAELRTETYSKYAWPQAFSRLFENNGLVVSLATLVGIALVLLGVMATRSAETLYGVHQGPGAFYVLIPYELMLAVGSASLGFAVLAMAVSLVRFWRGTHSGGVPGPRAIFRAMGDILTLRNLGGGGEGCNDVDERFSIARRRFHHFLFYGFMLCLASTTVALVYDHFLGVAAPYPIKSWPVALGSLGGIGMMIGSIGLFALKLIEDPAPTARQFLGAEVALLFLLFMTALTGMLLLALRGTGAMGVLLAVHLGSVLAFFLVMFFSRFVHSAYRAAALVRYAAEQDEAPPASGL